MPVAPTPVAPLPIPPTTTDKVNFDVRADAFFAALVPNQTQMNALGTNVYANAVEVKQKADAVQANVTAVEGSVAAVATYANAQPWAAAIYALNVVVSSPVNQRLYRKTTASSETVLDPSEDRSNWEFVSPLLKLTTESRGSASIVSGVLALDLMNAIMSVPLNANFTSLTLTNNLASATAVQSFTLELVADGTPRTGIWPAGNGTTTLLFRWPNGTTPTLSSANGKTDTFFFKSRSQFAWDAYIVGQNQ